MKYKIKPFSILLIFIITLNSCEETYLPKQKGFIRHYLPSNEYVNHKTITKNDTISSKVSKYTIVLPKKSNIESIVYEDIFYPQLNAKIHLTYYKLKESEFKVKDLIEGARTYVYDHSVKSSGIKETSFLNDDNKTTGMIYDIQGNAASNFQFYLTDNTENFVRGALYFNNRPNADSLAPYLKFIRKDMDTLLNSFEF